MVELIALALTKASAMLWRHVLGKLVALGMWVTYGVLLPRGVRWADETLPEVVNLVLPLLGILLATVEGIRHWRHKHHHHEDHPPDQEVICEPPGHHGVSECPNPSDTG